MSYLLDYNPGTQQWGYPRRGGAQLSGTIIVHTAECAADNVGEDSSAEGCANMIANRADWGSYHRLVDSDSIIDMLPWEYEAWQDTETNNWAVGISAALRTSDWATMPADRRDKVYRNLAGCAADFVQYMATKGVQVPLRRINGAQARARVPGFCAHGDSGIARTDPGADFDWALFFAYTAAALTGSLSYASESIKLISEEDELNKDQDAALGVVFQKVNQAPAAGQLASQGDINIVLARVAALEDALLTALGKPKSEPSAVLVKGDQEATVYAWDGGTGYRALTYDEFAALMASGAELRTVEQSVISGGVK